MNVEDIGRNAWHLSDAGKSDLAKILELSQAVSRQAETLKSESPSTELLIARALRDMHEACGTLEAEIPRVWTQLCNIDEAPAAYFKQLPDLTRLHPTELDGERLEGPSFERKYTLRALQKLHRSAAELHTWLSLFDNIGTDEPLRLSAEIKIGSEWLAVLIEGERCPSKGSDSDRKAGKRRGRKSTIEQDMALARQYEEALESGLCEGIKDFAAINSLGLPNTVGRRIDRGQRANRSELIQRPSR